MAINPFTGKEELVDPLTGLPMGQPSQGIPLEVQEYIKQKQGLGDKYSDENRQAILDQNTEDAGGVNFRAGLAALGAGLSGQNAAQAGMGMLNKQQADRDSKLSEFDKGAQKEKTDFSFKREMSKAEREDQIINDSKDPTSDRSKSAQTMLIEDFGMDPSLASKMTAEQIEQRLPSLKFKIDKQMKEREFSEKNKDRALQRDQMNLTKEQARDEKMQGLKTPYGLANTIDDAKQLKEAHESKKSFDAKIQEMIDLRKKYGGEVYNREAVGRGKQLSKDLLLEYKNMAKLGVLSKSDEDIINAIIPADPLEFQLSGLVGQDPIMNQLVKFKADSDRDFNTRVQTRTRSGEGVPAQPTTPTKPEIKLGSIVTSGGKRYKVIDDQGNLEEVK